MNKPLLATGVIFLSFGVPLVILWLVVHLYPGRRVDYHLVARVVFAGVSGARQRGQ